MLCVSKVESDSVVAILPSRRSLHFRSFHIHYYQESFTYKNHLCSILSTSDIVNIILGVIVLHSLLICTYVSKLVSAQEQITLEALTDQGTFKIQVIWTSNAVGSANVFAVHFIDPDTDDEIEDVKYDISVYSENKLEIQRLDQVSTFQEFLFEDEGAYEIRIDDVEDLGEHTTIPIQVTPEFGPDTFFISATTLAVGMFAASIIGKNLFRWSIN
jgi:hypothetical protein